MFLELQVIGHLGRDAMANNVNGKTVLNFSVAHTEKYKDTQGNQRENTTWINCSMWERPNLQQYLRKGSVVHLKGKPEIRLYKSHTGETKAEMRLRINELTLLPGGQRDANASPAGNAATHPDNNSFGSHAGNTAAPVDVDGDDLPF